jgi:NAD(P)-dependent dehydrogenase (short-subunit alcohol dehydrogenase family)
VDGTNTLALVKLTDLAMALTTKVALVTGAARGIGRAIALRLARDGLDVAVNDKSSSHELDGLVQEIQSKGRRSLAIPADVSSEPEVENTIRKVVQDLGSLDVVGSSEMVMATHSSPYLFCHARWWRMQE